MASTTRRRWPARTTCGRRNCGECRRWLHVTEYTVDHWVDRDKTTPASFKRACNGCRARRERSVAERDQRVRQARRDACRLWRVRHKPCAWGCGGYAARGLSICQTCDDEAYGWVVLPGGGVLEESELASFGFDHGFSGVARASPLHLALTA